MENPIQENLNPYKYTRKINENLTLEKISKVYHDAGIVYHKIKVINSENNIISLKAIVERHFKGTKQATVIDAYYDEQPVLTKNGFEKEKGYFLREIKYFLSKGLVSESDSFYDVVDDPIGMARKRFEDLVKYFMKYTGFFELDVYIRDVDRKTSPSLFWVNKAEKANDNAPKEEID